MKKMQLWLLTTLFLLALVWGVGQTRAADAVVGDGSPASCTEAAFDSALATAVAGGGTITFNCGAAETTIPFSLVKLINLGNVTIDGADRIILNAKQQRPSLFCRQRRYRPPAKYHPARWQFAGERRGD
jgi:hypothetical protein